MRLKCPTVVQHSQSATNKMATFHNLFISVRHSTCFRWVFCPSSGAQNCIYSVRYWSDKYLTLYVQFWAPDDGRKNSLKHVQRLTEINKLWNVASCWLYSANILTMHRLMNVEVVQYPYGVPRISLSSYNEGHTHTHHEDVLSVRLFHTKADFLSKKKKNKGTRNILNTNVRIPTIWHESLIIS